MTQTGYYHSPTIQEDTIVFVCEDDLWSIPTIGGIARRLTANLGEVSSPTLSPDGSLLAFAGKEEGVPEIYCMSAVGGPATRLTYLGVDTEPVGWTSDNNIIFASNSGQHFFRIYNLYTISASGGEPTLLPTGPARSISYGPKKGMVIGRNVTDLAQWKRYKGGRTGDLWIDSKGTGQWKRLIKLNGNVANPLWVGKRIYFVSDHEGIGNLYSCTVRGKGLTRHTHHTDYYVRHPATDGTHIVYHCGADLYLYDIATAKSKLVNVEFYSPRVQRNRKFVSASTYLESYDIHPKGMSVAITTRGKPYTMNNWENAPLQLGVLEGVRYRLASWLHNGKEIIVVSDASKEDRLETYNVETGEQIDNLEDIDVGRPIILNPSPCKKQVALTNHRYELVLVDLETKKAKILDKSKYERLRGVAWSPDGRWLAYSCYQTNQTAAIKLCNIESGEIWPITRPVLRDTWPSFDPDGKYLYFLSCRDFNPVRDNLHFDLNFPWGIRPYLITLQADLPSPFDPIPRAPGEKVPDSNNNSDPKDKKLNLVPNSIPAINNADDADDINEVNENDDETETELNETNNKAETQPESKKITPIKIDLAGIENRIIAFPVSEGRYGRVCGLKGKVVFSIYPVESARRAPQASNAPPAAKAKLAVYDFEKQENKTIINNITSFSVSQDKKTLIYRARNSLRVLKAGDKPPVSGASPSRTSGWLSLNRLKVSVNPAEEWSQMYREAWRLQRDHFWTEDMSKIDWYQVYQRYLPLLDRVGTRSEFSDLLWEMQGELGTSHAYEQGGDYRIQPNYSQGFLGADFAYDADTDSYLITHIVQGDVWTKRHCSPLVKVGLNISSGDRLVAINGRKLSQHLSPQQLLVNQAGNEVLLSIIKNNKSTNNNNVNKNNNLTPTETINSNEQEILSVSVKTLYSEFSIRYREWVESKRQYVHQVTDGQVGYIHIPDMGADGYAEFHRGYLAEVDRKGLIIDVRYNRGGNVSSLILEKLARRRLGYDIQRWGEPSPYPYETPFGPIIALCNEFSASDGDIFSHAFKLMGLGPLIGTRTWGGVIGINPRTKLVDGGLTTQPEFSFWFNDVGWHVENYGAEPDIEVEIYPQDYVTKQDPQLEKAIAEILNSLANNPPKLPDFGEKPTLSLPTLAKVKRKK